MEQLSDDLLWRRSARGDVEAFGTLFDRHARRVYGFCFRQTGNATVAEDLTSVTFLEAWQRRDTVVEDGKVLPWLFGVAHNAVRHERRSVRRYRHAVDRVPSPRPWPDHADETDERVHAEQAALAMLSRVRRLPAAERAVLTLVAWEGLTSAEAAYALSIPDATARSRLHRARKRLTRAAANDSTRTDNPLRPTKGRA